MIDLVMAVRKVGLEDAIVYLEKAAGLKTSLGADGVRSGIRMGRAEAETKRRGLSSDMVLGCLDGVAQSIGWMAMIPQAEIAGSMMGPVDHVFDLVDDAVLVAEQSGDVSTLEGEVHRAVSFVDEYLADVLQRHGLSETWWPGALRRLVLDVYRGESAYTGRIRA